MKRTSHIVAAALFAFAAWFAIAAPAPPAHTHPDDVYWDEGFLFSDLNGPVRAVAVRGDSMFVGGEFTIVNGLPVYCIALWNGEEWSDLDGGVRMDDEWATPIVDDILIAGNMVYICGRFSHAGGLPVNNVARWNGIRWLRLGGGVYFPDYNVARARSLAAHDGDIYIAGNFRMAGNIETGSIARWDGANWWSLGGGIFAEIYKLLEWRGDIYCAGRFDHLQRWDGANWLALYPRLERRGRIYALAADDTALFIGGDFTRMENAEPVDNIACWNGTVWRAPGRYSSIDGVVNALAFWDGDLYAGGDFDFAGGFSVNNIRRWDGEYWRRLGEMGDNGTNDTVHELAASSRGLIVAGEFTRAGGEETNSIARWDGSGWQPFERGINNSVNGPVRTIAFSDAGIFAGGYLTRAGNGAALGVAQWNGTAWSAMGSGIEHMWYLDSGVRALSVANDTVYAGGSFTHAGGASAYSLAQWDGDEWREWGGGARTYDQYSGEKEGDIHAIQPHGGGIYVGGYFHRLGAAQRIHIGKWNGAEWEALGSGISAPVESGVRAMTSHGGDLIVGGRFNGTGDIAAFNIVGWTGSNWHALGGGVDGWVWALASDGANVYAGGDFEVASGEWVWNIARWDGEAWHALGAGLNGIVRALAIYDGDLYAAGYFTASGTVPLNYIARWDGGEWHALGAGLDQPGLTLAVRGHALFVGGEFFAAGGKPSNFIARWIAPGTVAIETFTADCRGAEVVLDWEIFANTPFAGFALYRTDLEARETIPVCPGGTLPPAARSYVDCAVRAGGRYEYLLALVRSDSSEVVSEPAVVAVPVPPLTLLQNYPNPFRTATTIEFTMPWEQHAVVRVYDVAGGVVATLEDRVLDPGRWRVEWDGRDAAGTAAASGVYFYRLNAGGRELTRKMVLLK